MTVRIVELSGIVTLLTGEYEVGVEGIYREDDSAGLAFT